VKVAEGRRRSPAGRHLSTRNMSGLQTQFFDESAFPPPENKYEHYACECVDALSPEAASGFTCLSKSDGWTEYVDIWFDRDNDGATDDSFVRDSEHFTLNGNSITVSQFGNDKVAILKCDEITCVATGDVYLYSPPVPRVQSPDPRPPVRRLLQYFGGFSPVNAPYELSDSSLFTQVERQNTNYMGHVQCVGWYTDVVPVQGKVPFFESQDATKASLAIGIVALVFAIIAVVTSVRGRTIPTYITAGTTVCQKV